MDYQYIIIYTFRVNRFCSKAAKVGIYTSETYLCKNLHGGWREEDI